MDIIRSSGIINFNLTEPKPLLLLDVELNDLGRFQFILDTGASHTVISKETFEKLNLGIEGSETAYGVEGKTKPLESTLTSIEKVKIGATEFSNLSVAVLDLTNIARTINAEVDGIIGYNILSKFVVTIDYPNRQLTLTK